MRTLWRARIARDAGAVRAARHPPGGHDAAPGRPARLLLAQDLRPVARIRCRVAGSSRSAAGPSTSSGSSRAGPGSCSTCPRRAASTSRSRPRRRSPAARWRASSSATVTAGSTGRASASWCASTAPSARRRGGSWRPATTDRWPGSDPSRGARPSPSSSAPATPGATSPPTCATSTWWRASAGAGATTSCTGPSCRPSPRCAR